MANNPSPSKGPLPSFLVRPVIPRPMAFGRLGCSGSLDAAKRRLSVETESDVQKSSMSSSLLFAWSQLRVMSAIENRLTEEDFRGVSGRLGHGTPWVWGQSMCSYELDGVIEGVLNGTRLGPTHGLGCDRDGNRGSEERASRESFSKSKSCFSLNILGLAFRSRQR